jgi:hypothetical protein
MKGLGFKNPLFSQLWGFTKFVGKSTRPQCSIHGPKDEPFTSGGRSASSSSSLLKSCTTLSKMTFENRAKVSDVNYRDVFSSSGSMHLNVNYRHARTHIAIYRQRMLNLQGFLPVKIALALCFSLHWSALQSTYA